MSQAQQIASTILMIRPAHFGYNEETADNNAFQSDKGGLSKAEIAEQAKVEFDALVAKLREYDIAVIVIEDTDSPLKTDAVFPNNWISFHEDNIVITYPMFSPNRRQERRDDIIDQLSEDYLIKQLIRLEPYEEEQRYLEGTGSLILDRTHLVAYACKSDRTHPELFDAFCEMMNFEGVLFTAVDENGGEIYHTNVMMALGEELAIICLEAIQNEEERAKVTNQLRIANKEILPISYAQMNAFAGNMLEVKNKKGEKFLIMSSSAYHSLDMQQTEKILKHTAILHSPLNTIETYGGGSARCMMAEVFLPKRLKA